MGDQSKLFSESIRKDATYQCHAHEAHPSRHGLPNQPELIGKAEDWAELMSKVGESKYKKKTIIISTPGP